jgi:hypothetical protein
VRSYGVPSLSDSDEIRIGLQLAQEELAVLGASRQRVNQELKAMEREDIPHRARGPGGARPTALMRLTNRHWKNAMSNFDHFVGTRAVSATPSTPLP